MSEEKYPNNKMPPKKNLPPASHNPQLPESTQERLGNLQDVEVNFKGTFAKSGNFDIVKWADPAMYQAKPMTEEGEAVKPRVTLIYMTPNPLRVMAAAAELYRGSVIKNVHQISRTRAEECFRDMTETKLKAPLEFIDLHFLIAGVTRAFTHQLVRQRTAVYVQESMRFAVKENAKYEVAMPPTIASLKVDDPRRVIWDNAVAKIAWSYENLINAGIPAEDARGLLPTNITTRVHYKTNLRNLVEHSEVRLCSQAQFEWKQVWYEILWAIADYGPIIDLWQQHEINKLFKPICYRTGKCEFMSSTDRYCAIRERVEAHHRKGESSNTWTDINSAEVLDPDAARRS